MLKMASESELKNASVDMMVSYQRMSSDESGFSSDMLEDLSPQPTSFEGSSSITLLRNVCCSGSTSENPVDRVKALSYHLTADVVTGMVKPEMQSRSPCCQHAATLRRIVNELSSRHENVFESITKLCFGAGRSDADNCRRTFCGVVDELFSDEQYNWGRIVTVFAFAGWLARSAASSNGGRLNDVDLAQLVCDIAGTYIADKLSEWICQQGGWDAMDKFFAEPEPLESKMWRGLVYTAVGLGVLATVAAAVR